jgi:hypothetical protein
MWPAAYQDRLEHWVQLRERCRDRELVYILQDINDWWFQAPWRPYHLHWDDHRTWPTPWELLEDNVFCGLARALGIVYTIILIEHEEIHEVDLVETSDDNLVLVNHGKYILNWGPSEILNISSVNINTKKTISSKQLEQRLR